MKQNTPPTELQGALAELRPFFRRAVILTLVSGLLSLLPTVYMLQVYDRVVNSGNLSTLWALTAMVLVGYAVMEVLEWVRGELMQNAGRRLDARLRQRLFQAVFDGNLRRNLIGGGQVFNDLKLLREFLYNPGFFAFMDAPLSLVVVVIVFMISPVLGSIALLGGIIQLIFSVMTERRTQKPLMEANRHNTAAQQYVSTSLRNSEVIQSMGMMQGIQERWMKNQRSFLDLQAEASEQAGSLAASAKAVQLVQQSALMGVGSWLMMSGDMGANASLIIVASVLGGKAVQPIIQLISNWKAIVAARSARDRIEGLLSEVPAHQPRMPLPAPKGQLSVENVTASPPGAPGQVLRNVSFGVRAGECLAVVGPSGAGKTCLARALMGLWPTSSGKVRLDGSDVYAWNKRELGPHLGYLPQGVELFDGTVAENIARFGVVDMEKVEAAAELAGLQTLIAELPKGYDTRIGDDGGFLSGGQRQRVALARAVYGEPRFVVLDEPNSSLDDAGDAALFRLLKILKERGVTVVVITHRINLLELADRMLVLVDGGVTAFGPRDEVMEALHKARAQQQTVAPAPRPGPTPLALAATPGRTA
jgi:ATP-binding cassette subfamily C exporter for protease/lipase